LKVEKLILQMIPFQSVLLSSLWRVNWPFWICMQRLNQNVGSFCTQSKLVPIRFYCRLDNSHRIIDGL